MSVLTCVGAVLLDGLGLGQPDRGDLGLGVGDPRDAVVVDRHDRQAGEPLGDQDALAEADVRQLRGGDEVADRGDRRDVGLAVLVDLDEAAVDGDADLLVAEVGRDRPAADGDQQQLGLDRLAALQRHPDAAGRCARRRRTGRRASRLMPRRRKARSSSLELASSSSGTRCGSASTIVTSAPKDFQTLANSTPMTPPPRIDHRGGHPVELERVVADEHPGAVDLEAGQRLGRRAGRQHDVPARVRRVADLHRGGGDEPALALDELDAAALHQALQALVEPGDDALLVLADAGHVDALERRPHAELLALPGEVGDLAGVQQRLGRDAAAVQAGAAELLLLDQHDAHAELCRTQRAGVATAAAAQDDEVDVGLSHRGSPQLFSRTGGGRLPITA